MAEFDILELMQRFVETARLGEYFASDRPATGPERLGLARALRVDVVVQQVAILRYQPGGDWRGVVGPEDRSDPGLGGEELVEAPEHVGIDTTSASMKTNSAPRARSAPGLRAAAGPRGTGMCSTASAKRRAS